MSDMSPRRPVATVADVAAIIRDARHRRGLTQFQLAAATGITRQSLVNLETGRSNPTLATVLAALHALGLRLDVSPSGSTHQVASAPVDLDALLDGLRDSADDG